MLFYVLPIFWYIFFVPIQIFFSFLIMLYSMVVQHIEYMNSAQKMLTIVKKKWFFKSEEKKNVFGKLNSDQIFFIHRYLVSFCVSNLCFDYCSIFAWSRKSTKQFLAVGMHYTLHAYGIIISRLYQIECILLTNDESLTNMPACFF